jgi:hypothetical protein
MRRWSAGSRVKPCEQMAAREGWQIQRLKIDDGCYELRGTDAQGRSFKAKIDPETLKVLKMKQAATPAREREREREHAASQARPPQPPSHHAHTIADTDARIHPWHRAARPDQVTPT